MRALMIAMAFAALSTTCVLAEDGNGKSDQGSMTFEARAPKGLFDPALYHTNDPAVVARMLVAEQQVTARMLDPKPLAEPVRELQPVTPPVMAKE